MSVPTIMLNNGLTMPVIGIGTWKSKRNEVTQAVKDAIDIGYRHIDCAYIYDNEKEVGDAINDKIKEGVILREDIWVTSKLWNTFHSPHLVKDMLKETLENLQLDYLDLYLIHWPFGFEEETHLFPVDTEGNAIGSGVDYLDTWRAMEECVKLGLTRSIGLSNFNSEQVDRVVEHARIRPVTNQIESHPYLNQNKLQQFCKERGIVITAYSPLGSPDRPWAKPEDPRPMSDDKLLPIADKYGKTMPQIMIRYQLQKSRVVIPKSVTKSRIISNIQVFDFELEPEEMAAIDSMDRNYRVVPVENCAKLKDYPFHIEF